ncbi:MAG: hypothetical protein V3S69_02225 [Dehalococcoidales bacterium]|jgi:hypothetical protein|nr:hypothetical protein [Dehalococcoidales bacterium]
MNKLQKVLASVRKSSSLLDLLEAGFTPDEVKEAIIATLRPHFKNQNILEELAISGINKRPADGRLSYLDLQC